jgi:hypothetical protein
MIAELSPQGLRSYGVTPCMRSSALEQAGFAAALQAEKAVARREQREAQPGRRSASRNG